MKYLLRLLQCIRCHRINVSKTILINFAFLSFYDAIKFPIHIYGKCIIDCSKNGKIQIVGRKSFGGIKIGITDPIRSINSHTYLKICGLLIMNNGVRVRRGFKLEISTSAFVYLNQGVFISDNCTIIAKNEIQIGNNTVIGNNTQIIDTDFHYVVDLSSKVIYKNSKPVLIGDNNWIGGWCFVKKGSITPEGTILAGPYSMIAKDYTQIIPKYSIIAGSPAVPKKENVRFISNKHLESFLVNYFKSNPMDIYKVPDNVIADFAITSE